MKNTKKEKEIKGFIVLRTSAPYTPAEYYGVFSIFKNESMAKEWAKNRVHRDNSKKIVECTITYKLS